MFHPALPADARDDESDLPADADHDIKAPTKAPGHPTVLLPDGPPLEDPEAE